MRVGGFLILTKKTWCSHCQGSAYVLQGPCRHDKTARLIESLQRLNKPQAGLTITCKPAHKIVQQVKQAAKAHTSKGTRQNPPTPQHDKYRGSCGHTDTHTKLSDQSSNKALCCKAAAGGRQAPGYFGECNNTQLLLLWDRCSLYKGAAEPQPRIPTTPQSGGHGCTNQTDMPGAQGRL